MVVTVKIMAETNHPIKLIQVEPDRWTQQSAEIIVETPVSLTVNGENWLTFMCTPVNLEALALGFLYNEGLIDSMDSVADARLCPAGDNVDIWLHHPVEKPETWRRTSGCTGGFTTVGNQNEVPQQTPMTPSNGFVITTAQVCELVNLLFSAQDLYQRSGGVHTSVLSDGHQSLLTAEDIGRHNTLDKLAGLRLLHRIDPAPEILLTTGRISSDMLQKAARIGVKILISRTSPSSLSIEMAEKFGITVIGYARRDRFRIYTHPERIVLYDPKKQKESAATGSTDYGNRREASA
jgi:FdhD protein